MAGLKGLDMNSIWWEMVRWFEMLKLNFYKLN